MYAWGRVDEDLEIFFGLSPFLWAEVELKLWCLRHILLSLQYSVRLSILFSSHCLKSRSCLNSLPSGLCDLSLFLTQTPRPTPPPLSSQIPEGLLGGRSQGKFYWYFPLSVTFLFPQPLVLAPSSRSLCGSPAPTPLPHPPPSLMSVSL